MLAHSASPIQPFENFCSSGPTALSETGSASGGSPSPPSDFSSRRPTLLTTGASSSEGCMLASSSSVLRRQHFLVRSLCLGGYSSRKRLHDIRSMAYDAEAENILRAITPPLDPSKYKGQAGKVAIVGGCREYTGAPYFAAISALKIGADLSHVFCTKDAAPVIKSYSPELIVHPILEESYNIKDEEKEQISGKVLAEIDKWLERFDCLVVGPGLGRDPFLLGCVGQIMSHARQRNVPIVVDGDGLFLITENPDLVIGYRLAVLTPNINEYKRLVKKVLDCEVNDQDAHQELQLLSKQIGGVTIMRKGKSDLISDGDIVKSVNQYGSPRRCGGQGDILSGSVAVFVSWARQHSSAAGVDLTGQMNPTVMGCMAGSVLLRKAALLTFVSKRRSTLTSDIIELLGRSLEEISPAC